MNNSSGSNLERWKNRWQRIWLGTKRILPFAFSVAVAFTSFLLYYSFVIIPKQVTEGQVTDAIVQAMASATPPPAFSAQVYQAIQPSLVLIQTRSPHGNKDADFGLGSGVVVDQTGNILTSLHVVANTDQILVTFADGTQSRGQVISAIPEKDIALVQTTQLPSVLVPAVLGNPRSMHVGDEAFVVGNPFGLYSSMSSGVISGFDRSFQPEQSEFEITGLIQIDAAVNPGNSGGPLLNRNGDVIGIVTGIINPTQENFFIGIGFAVPIDVALSGSGSPPY